MRRLQSGASTFLLRVSMNFWAWGSSALPGGKRPVQSHSSCQPRSSLCLQMELLVSPGGAPPGSPGQPGPSGRWGFVGFTL